MLTVVAALADHAPQFGEERLGTVLDEALMTGHVDATEWRRVRELRHQCGCRDC